MRLLAVVACLAAYTGCSCAAPLALRDGAGKLTEFQAAMTEGSRTRRGQYRKDKEGYGCAEKLTFCNRRFVQKRCCTTCECRKQTTTNGERARRATADENQAVGHSGTLLSAATSPSAGSAPAPALDRNARWTWNCANMGPYCNIAFIASICPAVCAPATPTPVSYQGCYSTSGQNIGGYSGRNTLLETCADIASTGSKPYFGMEWPQGSTTPGTASCAHAMTKLPTVRVADAECGARYNGRRLGGPWRVAVYATRDPQFFTRRTPYGGKCEVAVTEEQCREHRTATEAAEPPRKIHGSFADNWPSLPHGCQLYEPDPALATEFTRIVFNRVGSDTLNIHNRPDPSQSRMVCPADECQAPLDSDAPDAERTAGSEFSTVDAWNKFKLKPEYLRERDTTDYADYEAARKELGLPREGLGYMCAMFPHADQANCFPKCPNGVSEYEYRQQHGIECTWNHGWGGRKQ
jgi:hypothetical protein